MERIKVSIKDEARIYAKNRAKEWESKWFNPLVVLFLVLLLVGGMFATLWYETPVATYKTDAGVVVTIDKVDGVRTITVDGQDAEYQKRPPAEDNIFDSQIVSMIVMALIGVFGLYVMFIKYYDYKSDQFKEYLIGVAEDKTK